jgi:hypothetical protein
MRVVETVFEVYSVEDLLQSENKRIKELKEIVLEKFRYVAVDNQFWYEDIMRYWTEALKFAGFIEPKIYFSGFHCQGDGACFKAKGFEIGKIAQYINNENANTFTNREIKVLDALYNQGYIQGEITHRSRYYHEYSTSVDVYDGCMKSSWIHLISIVDKFEEKLKEYVVNIGSKIYHELSEKYEYLTSDEAILNFLGANDYEFLENGDIY